LALHLRSISLHVKFAMGAQLPKAVTATVVEAHGSNAFEVGISEMNGWRTNMEDAHLIHIRDNWAFFGVFDGHGGQACSEFVAPRIGKELEAKGCPKDDAAVKKMLFAIDEEFLDTKQASGSTATMCIVHKPTSAGGKHKLRVINAGDSRVLLGRRDGSIVDGGGTDEGLTRDHKPDDPVERERIYRCGGTVETNEGNVARVNGDLAVSRGFGDSNYKQTGGPGPEDRPVTVDPELGEFECDESDFLLLVCDGVSEGNFANPEVVKLVADQLRKGKTPGEAATAVCHRAVEMDSKDNVTCMVVLLTPAATTGKSVYFNPGPVGNLGHKGFRTAYQAMAEKANLTMAQAVEARYDVVCKELAAGSTEELREEASKIGEPKGAKGSAERTAWFQNWLDNLPEEKDEGPGGMDLASLMGGAGGAGGKGAGGKGGKAAGKGGEKEEEEVELETDGYTWSQKGEEIQISFKLPSPANKKQVKVAFKLATLQVVANGDTLLDGTLFDKVDVEECTWCLAGGGSELQVMLTKRDAKTSWKSLLK